jgi:hypothetical protein
VNAVWLLCLILGTVPEQSEFFDHSAWNSVLQGSVVGDRVDYAALLQDSSLLETYLGQLEQARPSSWSEQEQLAFWINAYNAVMVRSVLDNWPLDSVLDISKILKLIPTGWVFHKKHKVAGAERSLNDIEHRFLRGRFKDPRIHAAINCASISCPPLLDEAYVAEHLDEQLDSAMALFLMDHERNQLGARPPRLSKIFKWFRDDFEAEGSLWNFVRNALPDSVAASLPLEARPDFLPYDWALNGKP